MGKSKTDDVEWLASSTTSGTDEDDQAPGEIDLPPPQLPIDVREYPPGKPYRIVIRAKILDDDEERKEK